MWIFKLNSDGSMSESCSFINDTNVDAITTTASSLDTGCSISIPALTITDTNVSGVASNGVDRLNCPMPIY